MSELEGFGGLAVDSTHAGRPALVVDPIQSLCRKESVSKDPAAPALRAAIQMAKRLFDVGAVAAWLESLNMKALAGSDIDERWISARQVGAFLSHGMSCIRGLYDDGLSILDAHFTEKRNQLPGSFRKLVERVEEGNRYPHLSDGARRAVLEVSEGFRVCRKIRDGVIHQGYEVLVSFIEDSCAVHISKGVYDVLSGDHFSEGLKWYSVGRLLSGALLTWLRFWEQLAASVVAMLEYEDLSDAEWGRPYVFYSPTVPHLAKLIGRGGGNHGWRLVWPCSPTCVGAVGRCLNPPGSVPAEIPDAP